MTIASFQVVTPTDVTHQIDANGLDALGLTVPMLSMTWASTTPSAPDDGTLQLALTGVRAPFTGTYEQQSAPLRYSDPSGAPITAAAGVLRLHPEAVHRLTTLVGIRLGAAAARPVPVAMLVHGITPDAHPVANWFRAGEAVGVDGPVSFHDRRGLVIDPVAVAALFADLLAWRPGLANAAYDASTVNGTGGVGAVAALAAGVPVRVHVVDPHGAAYRSRRDGSQLQVLDPGGAQVAAVPDGGLADLSAGQKIGQPPATGANPPDPQVIWGNSPSGTLGSTAWSVPALPTGVSLPRQFFRIVAADLEWQLLGNRGFAPGAVDVPAETDLPAHCPLPAVRRTLAGFRFLLDGADVLGAMGATLGAWPAAADRISLLCSPQIEVGLALPPAPGDAGHWPALPGTPAAPTGAGAALRAFDADATPPTATWAVPPAGQDPRDVIVTFPAGALPAGCHVRIFTRQFQVIRGIGPDPSFVRGDGGAAITASTGPTAVLLPNAFGLGSADPVPQSPVVSADVVLVAPDGTRRMVSQVHLPVGPPQPWTDNVAAFGGAAAPAVATLVAGHGQAAISPSSGFGIPESTPSTPAPTLTDSLATWARWLGNEQASPRIGPHLPSQARFDTVLALGAVTTAGAPYSFSAVLTGARYAWESRCARPDLADPGNPAGPDLHATGIQVSGQLAYDLALHALKRAQPIFPTGLVPGWLVASSGDNWNVPPADPDPPAGSPHLAGAMLETVAMICDSPELSAIDVPDDDTSVSDLADTLVRTFGLPPGAITMTAHNEPRLLDQVQREVATARRGQRDAMWSIARAVKQAREYVFIESPMFAATAASGNAGIVDLTALLAQRLSANPRLKVMLCVPRLPDFSPDKPPLVRAAFRDRTAAITTLQTAATDRVAAFHPIGFPGRSVVGRSTVVLVDDAYALVGTSHWRRRGMTFDGGTDVALLDRRLDEAGAGADIAAFRQALLAARLGITAPGSAADTSALWVRLAEPESAFDLLRELLLGGGLGRCYPVYAGPTDNSVIAESTDTSDPNGADSQSLTTLIGGLVP